MVLFLFTWDFHHKLAYFNPFYVYMSPTTAAMITVVHKETFDQREYVYTVSVQWYFS